VDTEWEPVRVPPGTKVVFVADQLIERLRDERGADGWSPASTVQVSIPPADGLVVEPQFRYVETPGGQHGQL